MSNIENKSGVDQLPGIATPLFDTPIARQQQENPMSDISTSTDENAIKVAYEAGLDQATSSCSDQECFDDITREDILQYGLLDYNLTTFVENNKGRGMDFRMPNGKTIGSCTVGEYKAMVARSDKVMRYASSVKTAGVL